MNKLFPMFVNLHAKPCTVIGGGAIAFRKILGLLECDACVRVISPGAIPQVLQLFHEKKIDLVERAYQQDDITGAFLVVAATNDMEVNTQIFHDCAARNILCNVVDKPHLCNFYYAATYTRGNLKIAISTNGVAPALARKITTDLANLYPEEFESYLEYLRRIRETVKEKIPEESTRHAILKNIAADSSILTRCKDERFRQQIASLDYFREVEKWL
jgi:precorrin-2 dehydrogenase/sirohydrochlorin ferrochelatase